MQPAGHAGRGIVTQLLKLVQRLQAKLTSVFPKFDIMLCEFMPS